MKHKLLTLASAALLCAACSDTAVSDANDEIKETSTVTFFVYDVLTRMPLEDVANYYRTEDKTKYTDSTGTIVWKDVEIGKSYFDFQLEGYAMKRHNMFVDDKIQHDVARVYDYTEKVEMYELGVTVKGKFYYRDIATKNWKPAANVRIYVDYPDSSEIYPNEVYDYTKEDGSYEFKDLAANIGFTVKSERFMVDSVVYEIDSIGATAQRVGVVKEMDPIVAEVASLEPVLLESNLNDLKVKEDIKLTFSEVLEKDSVTTKYVYVDRIVDDSDPTNIITKPVAVSLSLADSGKTVVVKSQSGSWADGKDYFIHFDVWSTLAKEVKDSVKIGDVEYKKFRRFTAGKLAVPGAVKGLAVKLDDNGDKMFAYDYKGEYTYRAFKEGEDNLTYNEVVTIQWNAIERNVDKYNIYVKGDKADDADYIYAGSMIVGDPANVDGDTVFPVNLADVFNKGNYLAYPQDKFQSGSIKVMVLAENSAGEALAKNAKTITVETFKNVNTEVKEMQTNAFNKKAEVSAKVYHCSDETHCDAAAAKYTSDLIEDENYAADLTISITSTQNDWEDKPMPDGYDLYYLVDDTVWVHLKTQVGKMASTFVIKRTDDESPFKDGAPVYKKKGAKEFAFAIVPFFGKVTPAVAYRPHEDAYCESYPAIDNEADCLAEPSIWHDEVEEILASPEQIDWKIGQTDIHASSGVFNADIDLQDVINGLD